MISCGNLIVIAASAAALGAMMLTHPDYNRALQPFTTHVQPGEKRQTQLFSGQMVGWRTADALAFRNFGTKASRDSEGVFLIADLSLWWGCWMICGCSRD